jgi:signal transduction histidine kinase
MTSPRRSRPRARAAKGGLVILQQPRNPAMLEFLRDLFDPSGFTPRLYCGAWTTGLASLHIVSDALIWLAYLAIPVVLVSFARRRRDLPFPWLFWFFGTFIITCGCTHLMGVILFYVPVYRLDGLVKVVTALASWATVIALYPVIPKALALRSPEELDREIAERKLAERALREKNEELTRANRIKSQFLANMSHELRTPLNAIIGFTGTLLMRLPGPLTAEQEAQLQTVRSSSKHLLSLINDLLDLSKIEAGRVELDIGPVDCGAVLREVEAALGPSAASKGIAFDVGSDTPAPSVRTDRRAFTQIVLNLAGNAIKFTDRGRVALAIRQHREGRRLRTEVRVEDTGIGIPAERQPRIFKEYEQLYKSSSEFTVPRGGTGLGLHLSQELAALLGGEITFESEFGRGSTFRLTLWEDGPGPPAS